MRTKTGLALLFSVVVFCMASRVARSQVSAAETSIVDCRALEVHSSSNPPVVVIVFHQRDKQDQARLAALLKVHSGAIVAIQVSNSGWTNARVIRLKSCFGRGLLLLSTAELTIPDGGTFRVNFSPSGPQN